MTHHLVQLKLTSERETVLFVYRTQLKWHQWSVKNTSKLS